MPWGYLGIRTAAFILLLGSVEFFKVPQFGVRWSEYLRRLRAAYHRGRASQQFFGFWFEHLWESSVAPLRAGLCAPAERMN